MSFTITGRLRFLCGREAASHPGWISPPLLHDSSRVAYFSQNLRYSSVTSQATQPDSHDSRSLLPVSSTLRVAKYLTFF